MARIEIRTDDGMLCASYSDDEAAPDCLGQVHANAATLIEHLRSAVAEARHKEGRDTETGDRLYLDEANDACAPGITTPSTRLRLLPPAPPFGF